MQINKFGEHDPRKLPFEFIPIGAACAVPW